MKNLLDLLERFSKSLNKNKLTKEALSQTIEKHIGLALPLESFTVKDGVLTISAGAAAKNEIRLKEEVIKEELKGLHHVSVSRIIYK